MTLFELRAWRVTALRPAADEPELTLLAEALQARTGLQASAVDRDSDVSRGALARPSVPLLADRQVDHGQRGL